MARTYRFRFTGSAQHLIERFENEARKNHLKFRGDTSSGCIDGMGLKATYEVEGDTLSVLVHRIPIILSWGKLESEIGKRAPDWGMTELSV